MVEGRLKLSDGRYLAWCERGAADGAVVFAFHGLPGSRLQVHPDENIPLKAGARVIHVDRPGFGRSDAAPGRRLEDWATDISELADHLHVDRFAIAGVSGGGPFACACAARLGERVLRAAIISSVGPPEVMLSHGSWVVRSGFKVAAVAPWLLTPILAIAAFAARRAPIFYFERLIEHLPSCDREILRKPPMLAMLRRDSAEAFRNGHSAFLEDLSLEARPWGINFAQVSCPVALWHGGRDTIVPPAATEALAALLPHATVSLLPEAGHFFVFDVWGELLRWLVATPASATSAQPASHRS
jgi:pimeloyl-ACP methyl ester carboxylesterase